jgi:hypothetical protein
MTTSKNIKKTFKWAIFDDGGKIAKIVIDNHGTETELVFNTRREARASTHYHSTRGDKIQKITIKQWTGILRGQAKAAEEAEAVIRWMILDKHDHCKTLESTGKFSIGLMYNTLHEAQDSIYFHPELGDKIVRSVGQKIPGM